MAATPQYGILTLVGLASRRTFSVDTYVSDVAGALVRFDAGDGASATSPDFYLAPENCVITDFAIVTGTADTTKLQLTRNGRPTQDHLRYTMHLTTLAMRPALRIGLGAGQALRAIQRA